ncbi:MAG: FKBP-type peptidyl-prolyl cis-trans isomerase [Prevotellaceae bacterium]|jgi:FKBP-type peptidyl-prolyl cis-trans isomerase|nr:FKBP-type peptidyl-prolyl cis-trans isomerase [Prevotellaceae bacterium]
MKKTLIIFSVALMFCACQKDFSLWREKNEEWLKDKVSYINNLPDSIESGVSASGLQYEIFHRGFGEVPKSTSYVTVKYTGWLIDSTQFETSTGTTFIVGNVIKGWQEILCKSHKNAHFKIHVPYDLAYGKDGSKSNNHFRIPPYSTLIFDIEILEVYQNSPADLN